MQMPGIAFVPQAVDRAAVSTYRTVHGYGYGFRDIIPSYSTGQDGFSPPASMVAEGYDKPSGYAKARQEATPKPAAHYDYGRPPGQNNVSIAHQLPQSTGCAPPHRPICSRMPHQTVTQSVQRHGNNSPGQATFSIRMGGAPGAQSHMPGVPHAQTSGFPLDSRFNTAAHSIHPPVAFASNATCYATEFTPTSHVPYYGRGSPCFPPHGWRQFDGVGTYDEWCAEQQRIASFGTAPPPSTPPPLQHGMLPSPCHGNHLPCSFPPPAVLTMAPAGYSSGSPQPPPPIHAGCALSGGEMMQNATDKVKAHQYVPYARQEYMQFSGPGFHHAQYAQPPPQPGG